MATGLVLMGLSFLPPALCAPSTPTAASPLPPLAAVTAGAGLMLATLLLSIGIVIVSPFAMDLIPVVGSERLVGTYYGWYYLVSAVATAILSAGVGSLLDLDGSARAAPFVVLVLLGLIGGGVVAAMQRRGCLDGHPEVATGRRLP